MSRCAYASIAVMTAILAWTACGRAPETTRFALPLGPGPEIRFATHGAVASRPGVAARGRTVALAWFANYAGTTALFVTTSDDGGGTFRPTIRVVTSPAIDAGEPPRLLFERPGETPRLVVRWIERTRNGAAVRSALSTNGGATFDRDAADAVRLVYTGPSVDDPEIPERVIAEIDRPDAANWRGVVDADGTLVLAWDESNGADRRIALQRVVFSNDGAFTRLPTTPVTAWGANARPAIATTTGGVIVAWVDDRAGRSTIALRPVGLETLCADPKAAAPAPLTFEWAPWPSHTTTTHRHHD